MPGVTIIGSMMVFFSITTLAVLAYPLVRLLPSRLERSVRRKIDHHRDAVGVLAQAMTRAHNDPVHQARLSAQHDWHLAALTALAPNEAPPAPRTAADGIDRAA